MASFECVFFGFKILFTCWAVSKNCLFSHTVQTAVENLEYHGSSASVPRPTTPAGPADTKLDPSVTHMSQGPENRSTWMQRLLLCHGETSRAPHWETRLCAVVVVVVVYYYYGGLRDVCDVFNFGIDWLLRRRPDRSVSFCSYIDTYRNVPTCTRFQSSRAL